MIVKILCAVSVGIIAAFVTWICEAAYQGYLADYLFFLFTFLVANAPPIFGLTCFCIYSLFKTARENE